MEMGWLKQVAPDKLGFAFIRVQLHPSVVGEAQQLKFWKPAGC